MPVCSKFSSQTKYLRWPVYTGHINPKTKRLLCIPVLQLFVSVRGICFDVRCRLLFAEKADRGHVPILRHGNLSWLTTD